METRDERFNKLVKSLCYGKEGGLSDNERMQIKVVASCWPEYRYSLYRSMAC